MPQEVVLVTKHNLAYFVTMLPKYMVSYRTIFYLFLFYFIIMTSAEICLQQGLFSYKLRLQTNAERAFPRQLQ